MDPRRKPVVRPSAEEEPLPLGPYLKNARKAAGLTLREVEARTERGVTNGYLSQIESKAIQRPSPNVLFNLARTYGLDYQDLMRRAGHHVTSDVTPRGEQEQALAGLPLRALTELNDQERRELTEYITFLRQRRKDRQEP